MNDHHVIDYKEMPSIEEQEAHVNLTPFAATFNMAVMMVGTSLVAAPFAFSLTTPYMGIVVQFVLGFLSWISMVCLFNSSCITNATSFSDLGTKIFNNGTIDKVLNTFLITIPLLFVLIGSLASYIVIASNVLEGYFHLPNYLLKIFCALVVVLLGAINTFEKMKFISYFAYTSFILIIAMIIVVTLQVKPSTPNDLSPFSFSVFVQGIPILALGLNGHLGIPGMSSEMNMKSQSRYNKFSFIGIFSVILFNSLVGFFPAIIFGDTVKDDIVKQLTESYHKIYQVPSLIMIVVQSLLGLVIVLKTPLLIYPLKEMILDRNGHTVRDYSPLTNLLCSGFFALIATSIAIFLPNLSDTLNMGAAIGSLIITEITSGVASYKTEYGFIPMTRSLLSIIAGCILLGINFYTVIISHVK